jgi:hypothetical protein
MNLKNIAAASAFVLAVLAAGTTPAFAATASETISTGGLTTTSPDMTFAGVIVTGAAQTQTGSYVLDVTDLTGHNAGWHVTLAGAALTNADTTTLVTTATPPIAAPCTVVVTGCIDLPANVASTAPFVISPTAVPLYSAAVNTGVLENHVVVPMSVTIRASVSSGAFTSTWTVSVTSGP